MLYKEILDTISEPIAYIDISYCYSYVNKAYRTFFNEIPNEFPNEFIDSENHINHFHQNFNKKIKPNLDKCFEGKEVSFIVDELSENKKRRQFEIKLTPHYNKHNELVGAVTQIKNVSNKPEIAKIDREYELPENYKEKERILNSTNQLICIAGTDGYFKYLNPAWEDTLGYTIQELLSKPFLFFIHPDDHIINEKEVDKLVSGIDTKNFENRYIHKNGSLITINWNATHIEGTNQLYCIGRNITERKNVENELHESKFFLEKLVKTLPGTVYINHVLPEMKLEYVSSGLLNNFGYSDDYIMRKDDDFIASFIHPDDVEKCRNNVNRILKAQDNEHITNQFRFKHADGKYRWLESIDVVFKRNNEGKVSQYLGLLRDISEQIKATEALQKSEERFRIIFMNAKNGIATCDYEGVITKANPALYKMLNYEPDELTDVSFAEITAPEFLEHEFDLIAGVKKKGQDSYVIEKQYIKKNGNKIWVDVLVTTIKDESDEIIGFVGSVIDINDKKIAQMNIIEKGKQLQRLNATKDKFFSIIAHDIRNPFNAINGFSDLIVNHIKKGKISKIEKHATNIFQISQKGIDLLENLLQWSRSQTGTINFETENIDFDELFDEIFETIYILAQQKNIRIIKAIQPELKLCADRNMITVIIRNLLSNAIKYTYENGEIMFEAFAQEKTIEISVTDNGVGIKPEDLHKLFNLENSYSTPGTNNEKGSGLGLVLCKEFTNRHNGTIQVQSQADNGTTFKISLPK